MSKKKLTLVKSSYLLRKFTVLFLVFSILPLLVIMYLFVYHRGEGGISLPEQEVNWLIMLVASGCLIAYLVLRRVLLRVVFLADGLKKALLEKVDKQVILDLAKEDGEVAELAKSFGEIMSRLEKNIIILEETKKTLYEVIAKSGKVLASVENFDSLMQLVLETAMEALSAKKGVVAYLNEKNKLSLKANVGFDNISNSKVLELSDSSVSWVIKEKRALLIPSLDEKTDQESLFSPPILAVPIIYRDKIWGAVCLSGKTKKVNFSEDEIRILSNLSSQIAVAFENARLSENVEKTYFEAMAALAIAVEAKDAYLRGHSERVGLYVVEVSKELKMTRQDIDNLKDACRLHDIGKIGIADNVLKKPGPLTGDERKVIRQHPIVGESIVRPLKSFKRLLEPIRHHHELLDGSGYPDGLKASQISLSTRVLTVVDIFEAVTSDRPYHKASTYKGAKKILDDLVKKGKIDKTVTEALYRCVDKGKIEIE